MLKNKKPVERCSSQQLSQIDITPTLQFLINCSKTNPTQADIEQICTSVIQLNNLQLTEIVTLAHAHGIFPLVYNAIKSHAFAHLSKEHQVELKQYYLSITMTNMRMAAELMRIIRLFNENGILALAFKGPTLAQFAYGDIALRQFGDLDILIKNQDIAKSIALLTKDQYIPEITLSENTQDILFSCVNVIGLEKTIRIEIHWELISKNYAIDWQEPDLWTQTDTTSINGTTVPMLAYNTHLLYLCVHGSKHLFERLEWVSDIDRFIRKNSSLEWQKLFTDAQEKGIERMLLLGLYLCHKLLALPLPEDIIARVMNNLTVEKLGNQIIKLHLSTPETQGKSYKNFRLLWHMRENFTDRIKFTCKGLFSPKFDDFKTLKLPRQLMFLYPIMRPVRLLMKYL